MVRIFVVGLVFTTLVCSSQKKSDKILKGISATESQQHFEQKAKGLARVLGKSHDYVGHAIIPFEAGGMVDMYYFPNKIKGTGFATMELINADGTGPKPNRIGTFELVAFTKLNFTTDTTKTHRFNLIERRICQFFTDIGNYSLTARIEPGDTMEVPEDGGATKYIVLDEYKADDVKFLIGDSPHGLLLIIEVLRDELEYARSYGSEALMKKLKEKGHYPYSDLNRLSVVR